MAAATLSAQAASPTGTESATLTVTSNQATGTVYVVVTSVATTPSHAQIVAGTDNSGKVALFAASAAGALSNSFTATGIRRISAANSLYAHYTQTNGAAEDSTPVSTGQWWLHGTGQGTFTANGTSSIVTLYKPFVRVSGTFGSGTATVQYQDPQGNWVAVKSAAYTSADQLQTTWERARAVRIVLTGSTSPSLVWEIS